MRALSMMAGTMLGIAAIACSAPAEREFGKADVDNITALLQDFVAAYNVKDAAKVASFFTGTAVVMPPNASTVRGVEPIEQYYVGRFADGASNLSIEPKDVSGSGVIAYVSGDYRLTMAPPDRPERRDRGKFLFVFRDFRGKWMLEYLMFSSDFPPVGPET